MLLTGHWTQVLGITLTEIFDLQPDDDLRVIHSLHFLAKYWKNLLKRGWKISKLVKFIGFVHINKKEKKIIPF